MSFSNYTSLGCATFSFHFTLRFSINFCPLSLWENFWKYLGDFRLDTSNQEVLSLGFLVKLEISILEIGC
uniref:Uncharacterized protein n=1 Tax=Megaselia scalaris TaxID=36166 RepID=T1GV31_MEGSC